MLTIRREKMTSRQVLELAEWAIPLLNLLSPTPLLADYYRKHSTELLCLEASELVSRLGEPVNKRMVGFESTPGVWVIDHDSGITILIWSDGHHKYPWKGTSYELNMPYGTSDEQIRNCVQEFFEQYILTETSNENS
jgi:hypothetical protein